MKTIPEKMQAFTHFVEDFSVIYVDLNIFMRHIDKTF